MPNEDTDSITNVINEVPGVIQETKKGYKTTEFWLTVATSVLVLLNGIPLPEQYEGFVIAALGAVYALSRGVAKKGVPHVEVEKVEGVTVTPAK